MLFLSWILLLFLAFVPQHIFSFFFLFYFPTVQQGGQVILTCIHYNYIFSPPFLLLQHEYLDSSQCYSAGSPCKSILCCIWYPQAPDPSHSLPLPSGSHKSFLQVHDFLFWGKIHLCYILDSRYQWYHMLFVFLFLTYFTQYESL